MTTSKHRRNATDTWLPRDMDKACAVSLWKENSIPQRREPAKARSQQGICEHAGSYGWDIWSTLLNLLYLHLNTWLLHSSTDGSCKGLPGGPSSILEIFHEEVTQQSVCPPYPGSFLPTIQLYLSNAGKLPKTSAKAS